MTTEISIRITTAYEDLKRVVMSAGADEPSPQSSPVHRLNPEPILDAARRLATALTPVDKEIARDLGSLSYKARAFLIATFDLIGVTDTSLVSELLRSEGSWLEQAVELLKENSDDSIEEALALLWLYLTVADEHYRRRDYEQASVSINKLWEVVKVYFTKDVEWRNVLTLALTEETMLRREITEAGTLGDGGTGFGLWERSAEQLPRDADDLFSLIGFLGLAEGRVAIRLAQFSRADRSLELCLRSTSAWRRLKLWRLASAGHGPSSDQMMQAKNFALFRTAVTQAYLSYGYLRRGRFRRALTQIVPASLTLESSNWVFSKIFADMIRAGAVRRLAGIHNEWHLIEAMELCKNTEKCFSQHSLESDQNFERDSTLLLRAYYELGIGFYYLAEIKEKRLKASVMAEHLNESRKYAEYIIKAVQPLTDSNSSWQAFWLANAHHILAFVTMKEPYCNSSLSPRGSSEDFEKGFRGAKSRIVEAVTWAKVTKGKWLMTETLTDQAFILNEWSGYYQDREVRSEVSEKVSFREKKRALAEEALDRLEEAWKIGVEMAKEEAQSRSNAAIGELKPRSNFAGPIYLYRAKSYALLEDKRNAEHCFNEWRQLERDVEYSRVVILSEGIDQLIKKINDALILDPGDRDDPKRDSLNFNRNFDKLKRWSMEQAKQGENSDAQAMELLGISRATYYIWRRELKEHKNREKYRTKS